MVIKESRGETLCDVLYFDCIRVNILIVILCYSFAGSYPEGKLVKWPWDLSILFLTIHVNYLKMKSLN